MSNTLTISFLAVLVGLTLLAIRMWYKQRGADVSEAERKVFARFVIGVAVFWLVAIAAYFGGPLLSGVK
jgi:uncharacterized membrane protein